MPNMRFVNYISQLKSIRYIIAPFLKARKNDPWKKVKKQGKDLGIYRKTLTERRYIH